MDRVEERTKATIICKPDPDYEDFYPPRGCTGHACWFRIAHRYDLYKEYDENRIAAAAGLAVSSGWQWIGWRKHPVEEIWPIAGCYLAVPAGGSHLAFPGWQG